MKRSLREELQKIHSITYGPKMIMEQNFVDKILSTLGFDDDSKKIDDPGKADLVEPDVADFFKTIQDATNSGGLSQQRHGQMNYQKEVESMQIGLMILGFQLPKYGVDGLFGPETARAVNKFKEDNGIIENPGGSEPLSESNMTSLGSTSYSNVKYDVDGTQNDMVSQDLLNDIQKAASESGVVVTITTAKSGHATYAKGTTNVSRHMSGAAVDISIINGKPVLTNRIDTNKFVSSLSNLGYIINHESGNPKAVLTYGFPGHDNHVHVSNNTGILGFDSTNSTTTSMTMATPMMLKQLLSKLQQKGITANELRRYLDRVVATGESKFTNLDLRTLEGYNAYSKISQKFIDQYQPNPLGITGEMMATGAKGAFEKYQKYVPPELALSQLLLEGGIGNKDTNSRPIRTKNPFNVGNTDEGKNITHINVQEGINTYYNQIAKNYMGSGKTAADLARNFVNHSGNRYAAENYELHLNKIIPKVNAISKTIVPVT
jgi:peptidoglycan hydrolase-like protein with peptidoglycan-binding domain